MTKEQSTIFTGDNIDILYGMNSESVDLIYLDPPFNSKRTWSAPVGSDSAGASFKDMWTWGDINEARLEYLFDKHPSLASYTQSIEQSHDKAMMAYITFMTQRLVELHRVLKSTGSFYLHVDPTASHYLKIILDTIFGKHNFRNELIWKYNSRTMSTKWFAKKHDVILFYTKTNNYVFNTDAVRIPHKDDSLKQYNKIDEKGRRYKPQSDGQRTYLNEKGQPCSDVFEIQLLGSRDKERTGYPTQKPLKLLDRIIQASSNEGDIVLDPFCGCATTCISAERNGRKWIGIDIEKKSAELVLNRLHDEGLFTHARYIHLAIAPKRTDVIYEEPTGKKVRPFLFKKQKGICKGCEDKFEERHFEVDHIIPKKRGGGDYIENFQLLCGNCNRIKGARPMDYLRAKIKIRRDEMLKNSFRK